MSFIKIFKGLARHKHRYKVFSDFVTLSAISLHNSINKVTKLEDEYFSIINDYKKDERIKFSSLFAELVMMSDASPRDVLGDLYMELGLGNKQNGQFFTPDHISRLMTQLSCGDKIIIPDCGFVTVSDPACGAGGTILAFVDLLINQGLNPAHVAWVQCIDIDRTVALMCYIQLSLWNVPAQIIVGNSLTLEYREYFYTPSHYLNFWDNKLNRKYKQNEKLNDDIKVGKSVSYNEPMTTIIESKDVIQLELF